MTHKQYRYKDRVGEIERAKNRTKSRVRSKVEHVFGVMKLKFGFVKVRYRGLKKNANRVKMCPDFCVNDRVWFLGMGCRGRGLFPLPLPISVEACALSSGDPLQSGHPLRPQNREVVERFAPVMNRHSPLLGGQPQRQK
jgi:Transposase DDE domain